MPSSFYICRTDLFVFYLCAILFSTFLGKCACVHFRVTHMRGWFAASVGFRSNCPPALGGGIAAAGRRDAGRADGAGAAVLVAAPGEPPADRFGRMWTVRQRAGRCGRWWPGLWASAPSAAEGQDRCYRRFKKSGPGGCRPGKARRRTRPLPAGLRPRPQSHRRRNLRREIAHSLPFGGGEARPAEERGRVSEGQ